MLGPERIKLLPRTALHIFQRSLVPDTWRAYGGKFRAFLRFCEELPDRPSPLPADPLTIARYITHLHDKGTVAGGSLHQYVWPIVRLHADLSLPSPVDRVVLALQAGFKKDRVVAPKSTLPKRVPLPCQSLFRILVEGQRAAALGNRSLLRACATVVFCALWFARAGTGAPTTPSCVSFAPDIITFTEPHFKGRQHLKPRQLSVRRTRWNAQLLEFIRTAWLTLAPDAGPSGSIFACPPGQSNSSFVTEQLAIALDACGLTPPAGCAYSSHSLRAGAATAALSIKVPLPRILAYGGWASLNSALRYMDPLVRPSEYAFLFFGHLL